jgi:hypothetical protein
MPLDERTIGMLALVSGAYTGRAIDRRARIDAFACNSTRSALGSAHGLVLVADCAAAGGGPAVRCDLGLRGRSRSQGLPECRQWPRLPSDRWADCNGPGNRTGSTAAIRGAERRITGQLSARGPGRAACARCGSPSDPGGRVARRTGSAGSAACRFQQWQSSPSGRRDGRIGDLPRARSASDGRHPTLGRLHRVTEARARASALLTCNTGCAPAAPTHQPSTLLDPFRLAASGQRAPV